MSCQYSLGSKCRGLHLRLKHPLTLQKLFVKLRASNYIWLVGVYGSCEISYLAIDMRIQMYMI